MDFNEKLNNIDFFSPYIMVLAIFLFLTMGYIGSFNYRFDAPLSIQCIAYVSLSALFLFLGIFITPYLLKFKDSISKSTNEIKEENKELSFHDRSLNNYVHWILLSLVVLGLLLELINLYLLGGIPLLSGKLKSEATTNLWRISYIIFLPAINLLIAKFDRKSYYLLAALGVLLFALTGYRTTTLAIILSIFITSFYIKKINFKQFILFIGLAVGFLIIVGFIASQAIEWQKWTLNPLELLFYRAGFTLYVFDKIIPLAGTTGGKIFAMIFSSGHPRVFIGDYVLHYDICLTSTLFGPAMLDFGAIGLSIQMFIMGILLRLFYTLSKYKKGIYTGIYAIVLAHTLIWIETGPTDSIVFFFYAIAIAMLLYNYKSFEFSFNFKK